MARPRRWVLCSIPLAAIIGVAGSAVLAATSDHLTDPAVAVALFGWITLAYVFSGLVAWWRRPDSQFGPLLIVAGFAALLSNFSWANQPLVYSVGQALDLLPLVLFLHVFL